MADNLDKNIGKTQKYLDNSDAKRLDALKKIEEAELRIAKIQEDKYLPGKKKLITEEKKLVELETKKLAVYEKQISKHTTKNSKLKEQKQLEETIYNNFASFAKDYQNLEPHIKKQLELDSTKGDLFKELNYVIAEQNALLESGVTLSEHDAKIANHKLEVFGGLKTEMMEMAEAVDRAEMELHHKEEIDFRIREINLSKELSDNDKKRAIAALYYNDKLEKKAEALNHIHEQQHEILHAVPEELQESVKGAIGFGKALTHAGLAGGALLVIGTLLAAAVHSFVELDTAAEKYRTDTGMTVKQTEHLNHQVHEIEVAYRGIGVTLENVYQLANDLGNTFSDVAHFSTETLAAMSNIAARTGTTTENASKVQGIFTQIAGLSDETAASLQMQVASLAQQAGVSPKEVLDDIAKSAKITSTFFKGDINLLKEQVIQAHRLGTDLETVAGVAEKLLDFEGGIEEELKAATFVGGQFNLSRARALAMEGKIIQAQEETLSQIQRSGDFRKKDYFTQKQLAAAAGMEVEEINKQLNMQERLAHLGEEDKKLAMEAIQAGLDTTNLNDEQLKQKIEEFQQNQKITGQITTLKDTFGAITANVGTILLPFLNGISSVIKFIADNTLAMYAALAAAVVVTGYIMMNNRAAAAAKAVELNLQRELLFLQLESMGATVAETTKATVLAGARTEAAVAGTFSAMSPLGIVGIALAAAAAAGMIGYIVGSRQKVGDLGVASGGSTMVSTKEGGLFETSPNDDVVAAPGAIEALDNASKLANLSIIPGTGGVAGAGAINILVNEMKKMRQEFSAKSFDISMDGSKVNSGIKAQNNKVNRNTAALV